MSAPSTSLLRPGKEKHRRRSKRTDICPVRLAAVRAYANFLRGAALPAVVPFHNVADRRLFVQLLRGMVRHKRLLEAQLVWLSTRPKTRQAPELTAIALLGLFQLGFLERIPLHAATYETVALAPALGQGRARGWINAILRRALREQPTRAAWQASLPLALRTSHPDWLVARWRARYGEKVSARICEANNEVGDVTVRVETGRIAPAALLRRLAEEEVPARPHPLLSGALLVSQTEALLRSESFRQGLCYVQDIASQLLLAWVTPLLRGRVLDACAAPGGKLTWLAGLREPALQASGADLSGVRLALLRENMARLRLPSLPLLRCDGTLLPLVSETLDGVILDVPCSATGMIRKYPDAKWRKQPGDVFAQAATQRRLLTEAARVICPGGWLLYATCSLEPEENEQNIHWWLNNRPAWQRLSFAELPPPQVLKTPARRFITAAGDFQTLPDTGQMGFYGALLRKVE